MVKPVAVLISDIHYNLQTLALADAALNHAVAKSNELNVPLIIAGDLHDTKANLRGECVTAIMNTLEKAIYKPYVLVGNHDLINEKSKDHSLEFLRDTVHLVTSHWAPVAGSWLMPYYSDLEVMREKLKYIGKLTEQGFPNRIIMHQGLNGSDSGDYILDKSALEHEDVKDFRVISGHYHRRQDIKTGRPQKGAIGMFSYIGNPYTLGFGEANHPEKGFQILLEDGTLEFVSTNLRDHIVVETTYVDLVNNDDELYCGVENDLLWVKLKGTREELLNITKKFVAQHLQYPFDFKLDLIPTDSDISKKDVNFDMTQDKILDTLIDSLEDSADRKARLKELWRKCASN